MKKINNFFFYIILFLYYDISFFFFTDRILSYDVLSLILFDVFLSLFISSVINLLSNNKIINILVLFFLFLYYTVETLVFRTFGVFMNIFAMLTNINNILGNYKQDTLIVISKSLEVLLVFFLPIIAYIIFYKIFDKKIELKKNILTMLGSFLLILFLCVYNISNFNFATLVSTNGLIKATIVDGFKIEFGVTNDLYMQNIATKSEAFGSNKKNETEEYNMFDIDFDSIIGSETNNNIAKLNSYISKAIPSKKNEYTGLFKNKNLIMICAEAFSKYVINKELTPTLYRLSHNGFYFSDYYQPTWGGSTSTGEYSFLTGLMPTEGAGTMYTTIGKNMYFNIGNQLRKKGYKSYAFHNGYYDLYKRNETHENLGFDKFIALDNGFERLTEEYVPEDEELFRATLSIDDFTKEPFCLYYMTISGHAFYNDNNNYKVFHQRKRVREVYGKKYEPQVENYLCFQLYLEDALTTMLKILDEKNLLENTVICLTSDHYPYGLRSPAYTHGENYIYNLYGVDEYDKFDIDKNSWILWDLSLENENKQFAKEISEPTYSLDILPTLLNLFGIEFDSRFLVGRDVFSDREAMVVYPNRSFITKYGKFFEDTRRFVKFNENEEVSDAYLENMRKQANNIFNYSRLVIKENYFQYLIDIGVLSP